ncbi:MAG TPA: sulfotransferase [Jatrophihabitantaceae bacterium]|jgi:hypothetical protein|nr:sulfotransferase [Jatrophihabitantaceae bacterium]
MRSVRPVLLVGCPRSGTTLLSVILHAHPRIAMPPETRFLFPVYRRRNSFGDLTEVKNRRRLARRITGRGSRFVHLGLNRRAVRRQIVRGAPTVGSAMAIVWREFARSRGKQRWGEKRPLYWQQMDWLMRLFPDAQVVHLIRDPRACVASLLDVKWWHGGFPSALATWTLSDRELRRFGDRAPRGSYYALHFEDLLTEPKDELARLCEFLGEDFDAAMLEFAGAAGDIVPERKLWHKRTHEALDPTRGERWRQRLTPSDVAVIEAVAGEAMKHHGYELSGIGAPASRIRLAHYGLESARRQASIWAMRSIDRAQRLREKSAVAADPSAVSVVR